MQNEVDNIEDYGYCYKFENHALYVYKLLSREHMQEFQYDGYVFSKDLESIDVNRFSQENIEYCRITFTWDRYTHKAILDFDPNIDGILNLYNAINEKRDQKAILHIDTTTIYDPTEIIKKEFIKRYDNFDEPQKIFISVPSHNTHDEYYMNFQRPLDYIKEVDEQIEMGIRDIEQSDLSPLEKVMACYFIAEKLFYKNKNDVSHKDPIDNIYVGFDKGYITCAGYTSFFKMMLDKLDIDCDKFHVSGHVFNTVSIKDEKYNIDGTYLFDAALDSYQYYKVFNKGEKSPEFFMINFFGLGKKDIHVVNDGVGYFDSVDNITELSIDHRSLLKCIYNVNCFIFGNDVDINTIANYFWLSILPRENKELSPINKEYVERKKDELCNFAIEYLTELVSQNKNMTVDSNSDISSNFNTPSEIEILDDPNDSITATDLLDSEYIDGTNIKKPRVKDISETDEAYISYLEDYYSNNFISENVNNTGFYSMKKSEIIQDSPIEFQESKVISDNISGKSGHK